ncbi:MULTISPECIES: thioredoxin [Methylobacterium]|nr:MULTISPECIES: thioredoxin [Methylobacterium]PIU08147.1 MAG: thioredoxin [Methylobacterium sp. CG09_land_8_20_14_0_10_71_15]PIU15657.1 MAG: thioredoxin [Methylobacterium sp. CG08_land_8_20_14_0_20_71_15]
MLNEASVSGSPAGAPEAVKDVTTASFRQDVIAESMKRPVLVDFWAPWCGPCKQLAPVIEKAVAATGGAVALVKMNIDEHPSIAGQLGIQSIPAVVAFDRGQPIDAFMGAQPESQVKAFVERLAGPSGPSQIDTLMEEAARLVGEGDLPGASEIYAAVLGQEPDNVAALAGLAKIQLDAGEIENARQVLAMVPEAKANDPVLAGVRAALELAEQAASLGDLGALQAEVDRNPDAHQARFDLALGFNARNERDAAVDQLVEIVRRDRTWNEDGARKQLLQFFEAWGPMDPAAIRGRRKLSTLLFS